MENFYLCTYAIILFMIYHQQWLSSEFFKQQLDKSLPNVRKNKKFDSIQSNNVADYIVKRSHVTPSEWNKNYNLYVSVLLVDVMTLPYFFQSQTNVAK